MAVGDAAFIEVVRADLNGDAVAGEDSDVVHPHLAGDVGDHFMVVIEQADLEHGIGHGLDHFAFH